MTQLSSSLAWHLIRKIQIVSTHPVSPWYSIHDQVGQIQGDITLSIMLEYASTIWSPNAPTTNITQTLQNTAPRNWLHTWQSWRVLMALHRSSTFFIVTTSVWWNKHTTTTHTPETSRITKQTKFTSSQNTHITLWLNIQYHTCTHQTKHKMRLHCHSHGIPISIRKISRRIQATSPPVNTSET